VFNTLNQTVTVNDRCGLHMLAAQQIVQLATRFKSSLTISNERHRANAKSILDLLMLAAICGSTLDLRASGEDAEMALREVAQIISPETELK